jgi:hypothetical protein
MSNSSVFLQNVFSQENLKNLNAFEIRSNLNIIFKIDYLGTIDLQEKLILHID